MVFYTGDFSTDITPSLDKVAAPLTERAGAAFDNGLRDGPAVAIYRAGELYRALNDENSQMVAKEFADERLKELGIKNIEIPTEGVTRRYLNLLTDETHKRLAREQIIRSSPNGLGDASLMFLSTLAGNMADPANLGLMLVPGVGEVKAGSLLGRTAIRFRQGAVIGSAQAAAVEPFLLYSANALGEDYTLKDSVQNIFFGGLAGGTFVSLGGAIGEGVGRLKGYRAQTNQIEGSKLSNLSNDLGNDLQQVELNNAHVSQYFERFASDSAYHDVVNLSSFDLEYKASKRLSGSQQKTIKTELHDIDYQLKPEILEAKYKALTEEYHSNTVSGRKAKSIAKKEIDELKQDLQDRRIELQEQLEAHKTANQSINDLNEIRKGRLPERLKKDLEKRKQEIFDSIKDKELPQQTAIEKISDSHWTVREQALRASLANAFEGRLLDVEPFFDLADPLKRQAAIKKLADNNTYLDDSTMRLINQANDELKNTTNLVDHKKAQESFNYQYEIAASKAEQKGYKEVKAAIDDAMNYANDDTVSKAAKAYAMCMIGM
ncbi:hypothetical protein DM558_00460 [Entomomonas moraniae]|uniref:Uncharacterized protein n=1 Tax=Entomomonas moraniae TaxID=2213226 RepID=A0A3Q9JGZ9_9GAMM|nr:hypothetical protein [Entomomonas moraniae]AZS49341.1 hypothetical protein DM558_00460 [Entomomonas moraniae]